MSEISASLVKALREKSGAGMMDCKKALNETNGNIEEAIDWLRKKGLASAQKKAGRVASEGLVAIFSKSDQTASVIEINAETDFVARNVDFQNFCKKVSEISLNTPSIDSLLNASFEKTTVQEELTRLISVIGENMNIRRQKTLSTNKGAIATYMHSSIQPNLGKIGVLVQLDSEADSKFLMDLGKKIAMHIAATSPVALKIEEVDASLLEREKQILIDQAKQTNRPDDVIQKMVDGRIKKFYEEVVLLEQPFVMDPKMKISQVIDAASKEVGHPITLSNFIRFTLGDGIEKEVVDFAEEVKKTISTN